LLGSLPNRTLRLHTRVGCALAEEPTMRRIPIAVLSLTLAAAGCYPAVPSTTDQGYNVIAPDRLMRDGGQAMYDVVATRWPMLMNPAVSSLQPRPQGAEVVGVYANRMYIGGASALQGIYAREVNSVRRLSRVEEFARYGQMHDGGGLEIVWRNSALGPR
jgi:hypothetical protein